MKYLHKHLHVAVFDTKVEKFTFFFKVSEVKVKRNELSKKSHLVNENEPYNILSCHGTRFCFKIVTNFNNERFCNKNG